jgi:hypothetical protein
MCVAGRQGKDDTLTPANEQPYLNSQAAKLPTEPQPLPLQEGVLLFHVILPYCSQEPRYARKLNHNGLCNSL